MSACLGDVEPLARLHPHAIVTKHAYARLRHHDRRILGEQQRTRDRQLAVAHETPAPEHLLVGSLGSKQFLTVATEIIRNEIP